MNQYYNYKKWRLAKIIAEHRPEYSYPGSELLTSSYPSKIKGFRVEGKESGNYPTKHKVDNYPNYSVPMVDMNCPTLESGEKLKGDLNEVLHNLRYVIPYTENPTLPDITIRHNNNLLSSPPSFTKYPALDHFGLSIPIRDTGVPGDTSPTKNALALYAGAMLHNVFDTHLKDKRSLLNFPVLDEIQDKDIFYTPEDIDEHSIFHPKNIVEFSNDTHSPYVRKNYTPDQDKLENLGLVVAHAGSSLYREYLDHKGEGESFEDYLLKTDNGHTSEKERLLHNLIIQMVQGWHLPDGKKEETVEK